ncbi:MAG TPA: MobC family replication-relaxation protein [Candidatus Acidoferrales bacterium]|nr:MobC family replication-relaxation protein [Candidatus Acidoferrales bacterium]
MTLLAPKQRQEQIARKRRVVLRWMREYTWTHTDVLQALLRYSSRRAVEVTLKKMERDGLIKSAIIKVVYSRSVRLWGLTHNGMHYAFDSNEPLESIAVFEPSKVAASRLEHDLDIQMLHARTIQIGWKYWKPGTLLAETLSAQALKIPDAVAMNSTGEIVALEIERTLKSTKRYQELLVSYLRGRKLGLWERILYLSPNSTLVARIERAFHNIKTASYQGETFQVTQGHLEPFTFMTYDAVFETNEKFKVTI